MEKNSKVNGRDTKLFPSESTDGKQQNLVLPFESYGKAAENSTKGMRLQILLKKGSWTIPNALLAQKLERGKQDLGKERQR